MRGLCSELLFVSLTSDSKAESCFRVRIGYREEEEKPENRWERGGEEYDSTSSG
jgi:hypothetical protein